MSPCCARRCLAEAGGLRRSRHWDEWTRRHPGAAWSAAPARCGANGNVRRSRRLAGCQVTNPQLYGSGLGSRTPNFRPWEVEKKIRKFASKQRCCALLLPFPSPVLRYGRRKLFDLRQVEPWRVGGNRERKRGKGTSPPTLQAHQSQPGGAGSSKQRWARRQRTFVHSGRGAAQPLQGHAEHTRVQIGQI